MNAADIQTLFDYTAWADNRIFLQAAKLTPEQFTTAPEGSLPSVRQILAHALGATVVWRTRFETGTPAVNFTPEDFPDVPALRRRWDEEHAAMRRFLATLDDTALAQPFTFERRGEPMTLLRWHIFFQLVNHGTQHRAEVAALLTDLGYSPGDLDFLLFAMRQG